MEATGYSRWFERLLAELGFEVWMGDPAEIKAKRVKKQKYDREDARLLRRLMLENNFPQIENSIRLFMAPGMNHCGGGDGPSDFETIAVLEQWREKGKAPDRIVATHLPIGPGGQAPAKPDRTRPLCPYPQVAKYKGSGSTNDASNFVCAKE